MYDSYLQHHGIKGMKWGIRRFQNEDGSLTSAGKQRYRDENGKLTKEGIARLGTVSGQGRKIVSGSQDVVRGAQKLADISNQQPKNRYNKRPNLTQEEMDKMSDKDLRDLVNRLNLEQQYSQLTQDNVGRSRVQAGLDYAEAALTIVGGAMSIAVAYKMLKG